MKKYFFLSVICLLLATRGQAQETNTHRRVSVGIYIGPTLDWLSPKTEGDQRGGVRVGGSFGIPVDINFLKTYENYFVSTGLRFEIFNGRLHYPDKDKDNLNEIDLYRKYNAFSLAIPTGLKLKTPDFSGFVMAGNFGFYHGFLLSATKFDTYKLDDKDVTDVKKEIYKNTLFLKESIYAGLGVEYTIKDSFKAHFYMNYIYGMTNFFNGKEKTIDNLKRVANAHSVEFLFGLSF
ncbi:MAG: PorT family protein [Bacteroidales bacterium]|jgi:hypothetical protein|nr:PorT family protein [Bacteroidales bacterium]